MKMLALAAALSLAVSGCANQAAIVQATQNLVALNNALVAVNNTLVNDAIAQAKLLAPFNCGAYNLAAAILNNSNAAAKVNTLIKNKLALGVATVAVSTVCSTLGYGSAVTPAPASAVPAIVGN